jgi:hypothetical protein
MCVVMYIGGLIFIAASHGSQPTSFFIEEVELPDNLNIRIGTDGEYPRVASLIVESENRLDLIESRIRSSAIALMHKLISTESSMLKTALSTRSAFVQSGPAESAGNLRGDN